MSGKGDDRRPEAGKGAYARGFDAIDWGAREREQGYRQSVLEGSFKAPDANYCRDTMRNGQLDLPAARRLQDIVEGRIDP